MRSGGSPEKGGKFERLICKRLSLWVTAGENDSIFWRTPSSGGRATVQAKAGGVNVMQSGDICAVDPLGYPFVTEYFIELKHRKDLGWSRGMICQTGEIWNFWLKACREAERHGKKPLLIARQNLYPIVIVARSTQIFNCQPLIILPQWQAEVCLFEPATAFRRFIRRRGFVDERPSAIDRQPVPRAPRPTLIRHVRNAHQP